MSHEAADWTEISLAIECGVLSEPAQNDYNGGVMVPSGCRATLDTGEVACLQCTVGIPYQQIPRCPLCGADFLYTTGGGGHTAGLRFRRFKCGTALNACKRGHSFFFTSISVGSNCHTENAEEDVI